MLIGADMYASQDKSQRALAVRKAFLLEWITVGWLIAEAAVAIAAALAADSLLLTAFGIDSVIELASAGVLIWRLHVEMRRGRRFSEIVERRARSIAGTLLLALALYVLAAAVWGLLQHGGAEFSLAGLMVALLAIPIMAWLARRKYALAAVLDSAALRADAMEAVTCSWLSVAVLVGLVAQLALGAWWVDPIASLAILYLLVREGLEAFRNED
jgi:divalent metal cation (Fe/Co/Zn/Cd) transporter